MSPNEAAIIKEQASSVVSVDALKNSPAGNPVHVSGYGPTRHWPAGLLLEFEKKGNKTALAKMVFKGPLRVQRPFYPEGEVCHLYVLHPPGGLVSGDDLQMTFKVAESAKALLTTPSAGKIYRSDSYDVVQTQYTHLVVDNAECEWLPQETIVFDGANGVIDTRVDLTGNARFIGWDMFCLGRLAGNFPFTSGKITQKLSIFHDGKPLLLEKLRVDLRTACDVRRNSLSRHWGYQGATVSGTMMATGFDVDREDLYPSAIESLVDRIRQELLGFLNYALEASEGRDIKGAPPVSVTYRRGVLLVRYLGNDSEQGKKLFEMAWKIIRPQLFGREPQAPRIWGT